MRADPRCFLSTVTGNRQQHKVRERFAAKDNDDGHLAFDQLGRFSIPPEAGFPPKGKFILKVYQVTEQEQQGEGQTTGGGGGGGGGGQKLVGTQLSQLPLDDHRGLIFGSEFENITEDNLILDRGQGVHNQHVAIWYSTQRQRMMIQSINGTTTIHSITRAAHTLINSDKYLLSNKTPNTLKLQITPLDGKKAFTADKCLFTISTPPQGSQQQQTNSKDKKQQQQQQPMKLYFVEGPHCGPDRRTAERLQQQQQQERQARDRAREDDRPGGGTTTGGHYRGSSGTRNRLRRQPRDDIVLQRGRQDYDDDDDRKRSSRRKRSRSRDRKDDDNKGLNNKYDTGRSPSLSRHHHRHHHHRSSSSSRSEYHRRHHTSRR